MPKVTSRKNNNNEHNKSLNDSSSDDLHIKQKNPTMQKNRSLKLKTTALNGKSNGDLCEMNQSEDIGSFLNEYKKTMQNKRMKSLEPVTSGAIKERQHKVSELLKKQSNARSENRNQLSANLAAVLEQMDADALQLRDHEQRLLKLLSVQTKAAEQAANAHAQRLQALRDLHASYEKQVEGLLRSGAMRPEDRPLWWDVYRAFPPTREPSYAQATPNTPLRKIFYEEDSIRAKFHKSGVPFGTVTLADTKFKTNSQKLIDTYNQMKSEGSEFEENLFEQALNVIKGELEHEKSERHIHFDQRENSNNNTSKVSLTSEFSEAMKNQVKQNKLPTDIKNIFKE